MATFAPVAAEYLWCVAPGQHQHTKLITAAARAVLRPVGLHQKGRSRTWLDDQGWWLGVVEFQPSSWSRGTYLNVSINWLWTPKDYLTFDLPEPEPRMRVRLPGGIHGTDFVDYRDDDEDFATAAEIFAEAAAARITEFRRLFPTPAAAATYLRRAANAHANPHTVKDAAIASGLSGDMGRAREFLARLQRLLAEQSGDREIYEWEENLRRRKDELLPLTDEPTSFRRRIERDIAEARLRLKLPADSSILPA